MNMFKKIIMVLLLLNGSRLIGGLPSCSTLGWPFLNETEIMIRSSNKFAKKTVIKNRSTFVATKYNMMPASQQENIPASLYNKPAKVKGFESILKWDFKLKVKLNRNMNIIFSYN
jgi:hypothetical protein